MTSEIFSLADIAYLLYPIVPLKWMYPLARLQGRLMYFVRRQEWSAVNNNFVVNFGETKSQQEIDLMTRQFFEYGQLRRLLFLLFPKMTPAQRNKIIPIEGLEYLDDALSQNKGVILLGSHLNSILMFAAIIMLRDRGYDVRVAVPTKTELYAPTLLRLLINRLSGQSTMMEHLGAFYAQFNVRPIVQCLAVNKIVAQTGDGWHSARFEEVEFLGRSLPFTTGVMSISQMTGAIIVPFFTVGEPPESVRCIIEKPFTVEKSEQSGSDLHKKMVAYVERLEHHLLENIPCWEHWLIDNTLDTMASWLDKPLGERYEI